MQRVFKYWSAAHDYAQSKANELGLDTGIHKANEYGRPVYIVTLLPGESYSYGWELQAERVRPLP